MDFNKIFLPLFWPFFKLFLALIAFAIILGLVAGIFTYGHPLKKRRRSGWLEDIMDNSMAISRLLIGLIVQKFKGRGGKTWLNDQELISKLRRMHPSEFEEHIARMFESLGYHTRVIGGSGDGGIDIEMKKKGKEYLVQCKKFITQKVTPHDVRDFYGAVAGRHINGKGFFITTNIFTLEADNFAEGKPMELIDGSRLIQLVRKSGIIGAAERPTSTPTVQQIEHCPKCGAYLLLKTNQKDGSRFYGCSNFPRCRFTKSLEKI